jgi:hypothetical protein
VRMPYEIVALAEGNIFALGATSIEHKWDMYLHLLDASDWSRAAYEKEQLARIDRGWTEPNHLVLN